MLLPRVGPPTARFLWSNLRDAFYATPVFGWFDDEYDAMRFKTPIENPYEPYQDWERDIVEKASNKPTNRHIN